MIEPFNYACSDYHPLNGGDMRRRKFIWLLLTALAISLHLPGTSHARSLYWSPYRYWWGDHTFRQKHQHGHKKSEFNREGSVQKCCKRVQKAFKRRRKGAAPPHHLDRRPADLAL